MALTVNTNVASLNAQRTLGGSTNALSTSLERLASGSKINSAKDDAAGLQISNRLTNQINGLTVAVKNANNGVSIAQTAEGAMQESTNIMQRMRDLALTASNGSNSASERTALQEEFTALSGELTRIADTTSFGGQKLLNGSMSNTSFQVGSNANETVSFGLSNVSASALKGSFSSAKASGVESTMTASVTSAAIGSSTGGTSGEPVSVTGAVFSDITVPAGGQSLNINGVDIDFTAAATVTLADAVTEINKATADTGVTASEDNGKLKLTSAENFQVSGGKDFGISGDKAGNYVAVTGRASVTAAEQFTGGITATSADKLIINAEGYTATTVTLQAGDDLDAVVTRINDKSTDSGVTASNVDGKLKLEAKGDITIAAATTSNANTVLGLPAAASTIEASVLGQAKVTGSATTFTSPASNSSISLNGTNISVLTGDTAADIAARIKSADIGITADASSGALVLTSNSKITIGGETAGLTALGLDKGTTQVATGNAETVVIAAVATGKFSINGKEISTVAGESNQSLVDKINASGSGVTAELLNDTAKTIKLSSANGFSVEGDNTGLAVIGMADTGGAVSVKGTTTENSGQISANASIRLNGQTIDLQADSDLDDIAAKINQSSEDTKVTAEVKNGRLQLSSTDGAAIKLENETAGSLKMLGLTAGNTAAKLQESTSINLNGTDIKLAAGSNMDAVATAINTASTGVSASVNSQGTLELFSGNESFTVADGAAGTGLASLGLTNAAGTHSGVVVESSVSNLDITTAEGAQQAISVLDGAMQQVDSERSKLGAVQNRFESTISNLQNVAENASASRGRIMDTDYAAESANLAKNQIMQQAGTAMLAQANQLPQAVLSLLG
ncbi:flagellin hook IN motif-containing protein [Denitrificimonas caeni]|uniref:flagellin hook IN motif-containing protein n=1 Tax=Denitrificimonas caeni TaxID=521720 RepID=UPI001966107E|nr:flagellin hook IN motif-containing protein [Denitrificimonas caeni]